MIIGGIGGVFRVGSSKVGYSETFFPIAVDTATESSINSLIAAEKPARILATVRILNDSAQWVEIGDVTYMSVSSKSDGSGQGSFTIANSKKWSVAGTLNPELLRPSYRQMQVTTTFKSGGQTLSKVLFSGVIETYSEAHGQSNGTISLSARSFSSSTNKRTIRGLKRYTIYRKIYDECIASGLFGAGQFPVQFIDDSTRSGISSVDALYLTATTNLATMIHNIIAYPTQGVRGNGGLLITFSTPISQAEATTVYSISDAAVISLTRSVGGAESYNSVVVQGLFNGVLSTQIVSNTEDIALRGAFPSPFVYGSASEQLSVNVAAATAWIQELLRDKLSIQLRLNPWLTPSTQLRVTSARLFMDNRLCRIENVTHSLTYGQATTTLSDVAVLEDA